MRLHSQQDLGKLIADLRKDHPRLVVLLGEEHHSLETSYLATSLLGQSDVGFFEQPSDVTPLTQAQAAEQMRHHEKNTARNKQDDQRMGFVMKVAATRNRVHIDEAGSKRNEVLLARAELEQMLESGVPHNNDEAREKVSRLKKMIVDRAHSSNTHMATEMIAYLDKAFPDQTPFLAVGIVGSEHLQTKKYGNTNLKKCLTDAGYHTITIDVSLASKPDPTQQSGDYTIHRGSSEPSIDYTLAMVDRRATAKAVAMR